MPGQNIKSVEIGMLNQWFENLEIIIPDNEQACT